VYPKQLSEVKTACCWRLSAASSNLFLQLDLVSTFLSIALVVSKDSSGYIFVVVAHRENDNLHAGRERRAFVIFCPPLMTAVAAFISET
jgi:hypothetical protein